MAANGLINKEKLRKTHLCFGNDSPRKISSYWRDYGPDTRIPCPLPPIGHRPQTPVEVRYSILRKFNFTILVSNTVYIQVKLQNELGFMRVLYRKIIYSLDISVYCLIKIDIYIGSVGSLLSFYIYQCSIRKSFVSVLTFQLL